MTYEEFLNNKIQKIQETGFEISESELNYNLFDFQKHIILKSLKAGRYAIFADCGLGKTLMQLEWAFQITKKENKSVLILCPLAVAGQTIKEGKKFNIEVSKLNEENYKKKIGIYISNYEQLEKIDCDCFVGVVLDESSILKNFTGKYKNLIIEKFYNTKYKLACTASPSPNDIAEIGNHSEFLNILSRNEMLSKYFVHDGGETSKWRLKGHAQIQFYSWISSFACVMRKPSDIGYDDSNYILPKLNYIEEICKTEKKENGKLFNETSISATEFYSELRRSIEHRMRKVQEIVEKEKGQILIWVRMDAEAEYLKKLIPESVEVRGSDPLEKKEKNLLDFAEGKIRILITKQKIAQFGMNFQKCNVQIFASLDFSFESLYQSIRRSYRFGQKKEVKIYLITVDTMENVKQSIEKKQEMFNQANEEILKSIKFAEKEKNNNIGEVVETQNYLIKNGDSIQLIKEIEDESIDLSIFSPPFVDLYTYSDHHQDLGNNKNYKEFFKQFNFLIKDLYRILKSGRNICVHCMDLPIQKGKEGYIGLRDFSGMIIKNFERAGFVYHSRVTIWKNPVTEMQRTKALGLLHKQVKKDSTMSRVGIPDYVLIFRKDGERNCPVKNENLPVSLWQEYASPVWMDIDYSNTLNGYRNGRDEKDEKHICPLQLDTIERLIHLYSNEGEKVFTPFLGVGSEVYQAVKMNRKGIGFELKESYFEFAKNILESLNKEISQLNLFGEKNENHNKRSI